MKQFAFSASYRIRPAIYDVWSPMGWSCTPQLSDTLRRLPVSTSNRLHPCSNAGVLTSSQTLLTVCCIKCRRTLCVQTSTQLKLRPCTKGTCWSLRPTLGARWRHWSQGCSDLTCPCASSASQRPTRCKGPECVLHDAFSGLKCVLVLLPESCSV